MFLILVLSFSGKRKYQRKAAQKEKILPRARYTGPPLTLMAKFHTFLGFFHRTDIIKFLGNTSIILII
jgi:hypothetical protein